MTMVPKPSPIVHSAPQQHMSPRNACTRDAASARRTTARLLVVAAGWVALMALNIWKPVWLTPPWLLYTPLLYALLLLAWLPVLAHAAARVLRLRWAFVILAGAVTVHACVSCVFLQGVGIDLIELSLERGVFGWGNPDCLYGSAQGSKDRSALACNEGLGSLNCRYNTASDGTTYNCVLCIGSSDTPQEIVRTYSFRVLDDWPVMLLIHADMTTRAGDWSGTPCSDE